jgi:hypothetical protein
LVNTIANSITKVDFKINEYKEENQQRFAVIINQVLNLKYQAVAGGPLFKNLKCGDGSSENIYRSLFASRIAEKGLMNTSAVIL